MDTKGCFSKSQMGVKPNEGGKCLGAKFGTILGGKHSFTYPYITSQLLTALARTTYNAQELRRYINSVTTDCID